MTPSIGLGFRKRSLVVGAKAEKNENFEGPNRNQKKGGVALFWSFFLDFTETLDSTKAVRSRRSKMRTASMFQALQCVAIKAHNRKQMVGKRNGTTITLGFSARGECVCP